MILFLVSEALLVNQLKIIQQAFPQAMIVPFYGMSEKVSFAGALINNIEIYDFEPLYGYTELLDENNVPIRKIGIRGRIVSTGFISTSMPMLRYDTEDEAELVELPSKKNHYRLRVKNIHPRRTQEFIVSSDNALISMTSLNLHSKEYSIRNIRCKYNWLFWSSYRIYLSTICYYQTTCISTVTSFSFYDCTRFNG